MENGTKIYAEYRNGQRNGIGKIYWPEGETYFGEIKNNLVNGYGIKHSTALNNAYTGQWKDDKTHGYGV